MMLKKWIKDKKLREKLTPTYKFGCKRVLKSDDYLRVFAQSNVHLHTEPVAGLDKDGVVCNGSTHNVDVSFM